jgi:type II restriction enzyme
MKYSEVVPLLNALCADTSLDFPAKADRLRERLQNSSSEEVVEHLDRAGVIPESFGHDSTEEKLFAKYCDFLLARSLRELGLVARIIEERADAADVEAHAEGYSIVGDAKAFRLSRTAKNQKDFKVEALNKWRKGADYACLVCPLYQYPNKSSQIYAQAVRYNVTLLSYTHLAFMLRRGRPNPARLNELWKVGSLLKETGNAQVYWESVTRTMLAATGGTLEDWRASQARALAKLPEHAREEIAFLEQELARIQNLSHAQAVKELVVALKIEAKIKAIRSTAGI